MVVVGCVYGVVDVIGFYCRWLVGQQYCYCCVGVGCDLFFGLVRVQLYGYMVVDIC